MNQLDYSDFNQDIFSEVPDNLPEYTVSDLQGKIKKILKDHFPTEIWLIGEIVKENKKLLKSGQPYLILELADEEKSASVKIMVWPQYLQFVEKKFSDATGEKLKEGIKVRLKGSLEHHITYGLQLKATDIDPSVTLGDIAKKRKIIIEKLKKDGVWEKNTNLSAPFDFFRVVVISPSSASSLADFKSTADILENVGLCHFDYLESPFEGLHVEESISTNLLKAAHIHVQDPIDAVTIIRGGGSRQGLLDLMNEKLARLICNFPVPVITGIGHKDDKGFVVDEVSNVNKDTPSKVVEYILSTIRENAKNASMNIDHIIKDAKYIMNRANTHLYHLTSEMDTRSSETLLFQHEKVHNYSSKLGDQSNHRLRIEESTLKTQLTLLKERATERIRNSKSLLSEYIRIIEKFGPESLLKRGLVIARTKSKKVIKTKEKAQSENTLTLTFQDGDVDVSL